MLKGAVGIELRMTEGDEYGIYRRNESGQIFLLFSFDDESEWLAKGKAIADIFSLPLRINRSDPRFGKEVVKEKNLERIGAEPSTTPSQLKKVSGVGNLCRTYIQQGLSNEEIVQNLLPKYFAVGRNEKSARTTILCTLLELRKKENRDD